MTFRLILRNSSPPSVSPYRLLGEQNRELAWANAFLDAQRVRQLSLRSLRAYGYDLLHLARWLHLTRHPLAKINQSLMLDYVRYQLDQLPKPTPSTINHRLGVLHCLYRFHYGREIPGGKSHFQHTYTTRSPLGYGRPQPKLATGLRLRQPRLAEAARRAGCTSPVTPHRLRHSFATEMLRLGVSLPALMQLLGHSDIRMTLRYVQVTQQDLQREFHLARLNTAPLHS